MEDVQIHASSRGQDGSDAGPESFELRVFLQGLRQKQHRWGAAWGIRKRFKQRFCIERVLTRARRALRAIVCKMWLSLPKRKVAVDYSLHASLTSSWRWHRSSPIPISTCGHKNLPNMNLGFFFRPTPKKNRGKNKTPRLWKKCLIPGSAKTVWEWR